MSVLDKAIAAVIASRLADQSKAIESLQARAPTPGPCGKEGEQGKQGETGEQGPKGADGERGEKGEAGPQGDHGKQGEPGQKGDAGPQGKIGERGEKGEAGNQGTPGAAGIKGDTGPQGKQGEKGDQGPRGEKGDTGPSPDHEWRGTSLRFEKPDGTWGKFTNLRGSSGMSFGSGGSSNEFDPSQLPQGNYTEPEEFIVKQSGKWVRVTLEQMREWLGGSTAPAIDGVITSEDGRYITGEDGRKIAME